MNDTAQPSATVTATASTTQPVTAPDAQQPQQGGGLFGSFGGFLPLILIFAIFYFMLLRPQQRKEKERQKMVSELRVGQKVSFAGGLIGTIAEVKEQTFIIELCPGSKVEVARGAVSASLDEPEAKK